ncbi:MAG: hydantoinase/oxoprolinase family protein [Alphaproteobacteria bacterium]|nr:hydantoinase/oxoprolinase family protein [Alphaproteobacteria bacterium]
MSRYRITVDTGGTFTDVVYFDEARREITIHKLPSTPHNPSEAIVAGVRHLLDQGVAAEDIEFFCHGTTVGTNALLEGKGAKTGLLVTKGFRGIYEVGEQSTPHGPSVFDITYRKPPLLAPESLTGEVKERVDFQGKVLEKLDEEALRKTVRALRDKGVESVAVCLLFSFLYPRHEQRIARILREEAPGVSISLSSDILPQIREFFRLSTTVINAYLLPVLEHYIHHLEAQLDRAGVKTKKRYIMQSNGGTATFEAAARKSVTTVLSGPAGGVTAGANLARDLKQPNLITFDMGGTSCDVALIKDGEPSHSNRIEVDGRVISVPMMDINTVSAGGGTIARADALGQLQVGPDSAGALPGPACYGHGGTQPTVTDANLLLGYLGEDNFLGGRMALDVAQAKKAMETGVARPLGMSLADAAEGVIRIINVKMEEAIKAISTMRGYDLRDFMLVAFGGAGPLHAGQMARNLGMRGVIVPLYPGVNSAIGLLQADVRHDYAVSRMTLITEVGPQEVAARLKALADQARAELKAEGFKAGEIVIEYGIDMRYAGQGYELTVPLSSGRVTGKTLGEIRETFDTTHHGLFGHSGPEEPVEVVTYRVTGIGKLPEVKMPTFRRAGTALADAYLGTRRARFDGEAVEAAVYQRERLDVGHEVKGPAVIEQLDSTLVVHPGQTARVDRFKNIAIMERD